MKAAFTVDKNVHPPGSGFGPRSEAAFTLLEMLVATAVFSLMIVLLLQLTSGLMTNANRVDENLKIDQEVRILFDLMRRDLAQARIGTNQNQFYGTATQVSFVSSTSRLKTNYVSDQRLVTYFYASNTIYRAVVEPTISNYPTVWNPLQPSWWTNDVKTNAEALLEGVFPYDTPPYTSVSYTNPFTYKLRTQVDPVWDATNTTNPPSGLTIGFAVASRSATRSGRADNTNERKKMKYDIELNIPPPFNP
jgi:type II secretory pathway pseudopilin PulG